MRKVLNVGGGSKQIPLPPQYAGWQHVLLDIDQQHAPDIACDARKLTTLGGSEYDAVYCSHNLEHYYRHDLPAVLAGFHHVLKPDGFAHIVVPDIAAVMKTVTEEKLDIEDVLYQSPRGPITVADVVYGYGAEIESSGNDFYAHKNGFTQRSLSSTLTSAGFSTIFVNSGNLEIHCLAFRGDAAPYAVALFGLPAPKARQGVRK